MHVSEPLTVFATALVLITLAEMGDKTQFSVITLATRYPAIPVAGGSILAFALVNGIAVVAGLFFLAFFPVFWVKVASAALFLLFGAYTLYGLNNPVEEDETTGPEVPPPDKSAFVSSFSLIFLMELGDKTQIATATLVASNGHPVAVFAGVILGLSILTVIGVKLGSGISKRISRRKMDLIAGLLFIFFGLLMLAGAIHSL